MHNNVLVITGMHRSGTSLLSHWLHACGLHLGERLLEGGKGNVDGHFEDLDFLELHQAILGGQTGDDTGLGQPRAVAPGAAETAKIRGMIAQRNAQHTQWGWKEPRTCLFLGSYRGLLPQARYLVVFRDYPSVVGSLIMRDFSYTDARYMARSWLSRQIWTRLQRAARLRRHCRKNSERYLRAWIHYNDSILQTLAALPEQRQMVVDSGMLKKRSGDVFHFLSNVWNFKLRHKKFSDIYNNKLISKKADCLAQLDNPALLEEARRVTERFNSYLYRSGERLDEAQHSFRHSPPPRVPAHQMA